MAIRFDCEGCGKSYTVGDDMAGQTGRCQQCGRTMTVPKPSVPDPDGFEFLANGEAEAALLPPSQAAATPTRGRSIGRGRLFAIVAVLGLLAVSVVIRPVAINRRPAPAEEIRGTRTEPDAPRLVPEEPPPWVANPAARPVAEGPTSKNLGVKLPRFPGRGPVREIESGITFREIPLGPPDPVPGGLPGHCGRLWLYLPAGKHPARSLPCILIAGAGSTLYAGRKLADGDIPEHLPYARAGYAVLAFDVDGMLENRRNPKDEAILEAAGRFQAAQAGLVNAEIALEYVLAKVPEVDPKRITAAGHSSAGTLALLFVEHEPRLRSCIAYAPVVDIPRQFRRSGLTEIMDVLDAAGFGALFTRYSPSTDESRLDRPLFLFYALDDASAPDLAAFGERLKAAGKPVTIATVPTGGSVQSMARDGIPAAIAWLKGQDR